MRVLMLSWEFPPHMNGGLGAHVAELVPALAAQDVELTVVTPRWKGGDAVERLNGNALVYRVEPPVPEPTNLYADAQHTNLTLVQFVHALWTHEHPFDLIHAHDWLVSFAAEELKQHFKTPLLATVHATERGRGGGNIGGEMAELINGAEWRLTYQAWRVIATSQYMANEVQSFFQVPRDKVSVIPNGVETERFEYLFQQDLSTVRDEWALSDEKIVFYVGRLQYEKGVHLLVEAAQRLIARGEQVKFVIAGKGAMLAPLRERVAEIGLQDKILLPGYIDDATRDCLYRVADVAVFPSLYEPFGIVALEAMAAKCPVIVSNVGGLGEVVENNVTGIKILPYNLDFLVDAIRSVLNDAPLARERAESAYNLVRREYTWEQIALTTIALYQEIIEARKRVVWE